MTRLRSNESEIVPRNSVETVRVTLADGSLSSRELWPPFSDIVGTTSICIDETHPGPPYRSGGGLGITHSVVPVHSCGSVRLHRAVASPWEQHYDVDFRPAASSSCPVNIAVLGEASKYGATGWKRFKPGKTGANMGQFLAELRDFPKLFKVGVKSFRDVGGNYLNYQFGWKPFVNDLKSFLDLTVKLDKRMQYLKRNNNRFRKRGGSILSESDTAVRSLISWPFTPLLSSGFYPQWSFSHTTTESVKVERNVWFEALMRFYIPDIDSPARRLKETIRQFGLVPSPSLVYELVPWSWLIDYFSNLGDVISNLSDSEAAPNLVALYAYVMNTTVITRTITSNFNMLKYYAQESSTFPVHLSFTQSWVSKSRAAASPFGFDVQSDALSDYQLSILSAIGISRFPKVR